MNEEVVAGAAQELDLRNVLIAIPSYRGLDPHTEVTVNASAIAGALIIRSAGNADVTLHRCMLAGLVERALKKASAADIQAILWLDSDMVASVEDVLALYAYLTLAQPAQTHDGGGPSVSATYVQSKDSRLIAARRLEAGEPDLEVCNDEREQVSLPPVYSGMGALMMTRRSFELHLQESQRVWIPEETHLGLMHMPAITASGPAPLSDDMQWMPIDGPRKPLVGETILVSSPALRGRTESCSQGAIVREWSEDLPRQWRLAGNNEPLTHWRYVHDMHGWSSEDFSFSAWEWQRNRGVYLAPINFGHRITVTAYPNANTVLKG